METTTCIIINNAKQQKINIDSAWFELFKNNAGFEGKLSEEYPPLITFAKEGLVLLISHVRKDLLIETQVRYLTPKPDLKGGGVLLELWKKGSSYPTFDEVTDTVRDLLVPRTLN